MSRRAPFTHQDGTDCWTKDCSLNHKKSSIAQLQNKIEALFDNTANSVGSPITTPSTSGFTPQPTATHLLEKYSAVLNNLTFEDTSIEAEELDEPPKITIGSLKDNRWGSVNNCTPATIVIGEFIEKNNLFNGEVSAISIQFKPNKKELNATFHNAVLLIGEDGSRTILDYTAAQWGGKKMDFPVQMSEQNWLLYTKEHAWQAYQLEIENVEIL